MAIEGLRFELFVDDVERSVRFYGEVLGLSPTRDVNPDAYVPVASGALTIGLQRRANLPPSHPFHGEFDGRPGVGVEIVVEVEDVDLNYQVAVNRVERLGGQLVPIGNRPWGLRDYRMIDPDGYYVRVTSRRD
jgi:lactoylglutathione lyase